MAGKNTQSDDHDVGVQWMQITQSVAKGSLPPERGVELLRDLAEAHPDDHTWLLEEVETIRRQFGLDVDDCIREGKGSYWENMRLVIDALLDDRLDHERALELLNRIATAHPEHSEQTAELIRSIADSPLRRLLDSDEARAS